MVQADGVLLPFKFYCAAHYLWKIYNHLHWHWCRVCTQRNIFYGTIPAPPPFQSDWLRRKEIQDASTGSLKAKCMTRNWKEWDSIQAAENLIPVCPHHKILDLAVTFEGWKHVLSRQSPGRKRGSRQCLNHWRIGAKTWSQLMDPNVPKLLMQRCRPFYHNYLVTAIQAHFKMHRIIFWVYTCTYVAYTYILNYLILYLMTSLCVCSKAHTEKLICRRVGICGTSWRDLEVNKSCVILPLALISIYFTTKTIV